MADSWLNIPDRTSDLSSMFADLNALMANLRLIKGGTAGVAPTQTLEQVIITLAGVLTVAAMPGYINGLTLSNNSGDANNDIDIAIGACVDSSNAYSMVLSSGLTKRLDASWAVGTGNGGLFSGSKANSTWYHVFLIRKDSDGSIDAGFDTSITATNIPSGYTAYRRVGSILTDGSGNITAFVQNGDEFRWKSPTLEVDVVNLGSSASLYAIKTPLGISIKGLLNYSIVRNSATAYGLLSSPLVDDLAPSLTAAPLSNLRSPYTSSLGTGQVETITDTNSQVRARADAASTTLRLSTIGYIDTRGKY